MNVCWQRTASRWRTSWRPQRLYRSNWLRPLLLQKGITLYTRCCGIILQQRVSFCSSLFPFLSGRGSRLETEIIGFAGRRTRTGSREKWKSQTTHQKSNYIILLQNNASHMPGILRLIHAGWHKSKNQRERNSPELRKSNFEATGWCLLFTLKKESASKSVNCLQKGDLYRGTSMEKAEIHSR